MKQRQRSSLLFGGQDIIQFLAALDIFCFIFLNILYCEVKQTKTILQKHFHPSSLNHRINAQMQCQEPKKGQQKVSNYKENKVLISSSRSCLLL